MVWPQYVKIAIDEMYKNKKGLYDLTYSPRGKQIKINY